MQTEEAAVAGAENTAAAAVDVRLAGVRKRYGDVVAVDGVDLEIRRGRVLHDARARRARARPPACG